MIGANIRMVNSLPESIHRVIQEIVSRCKPVRVYLFGSRARGDHRENSDFDIAIEGKQCDESDWTLLLVELEDEPWTLYKVDLVEIEKLSEEYQKNIRREGKILYESPDYFYD